MADNAHDHSQHTQASDGGFQVSRMLAGLAIGSAAVMLAPHVLPAIGVGSETLAEQATSALHTGAQAGGSGLAGFVNQGLSHIPLIGERLAEGGLFNAVVTVAIGISGVLIGSKMAKKEKGAPGIHWGRVIEYAALATSALIALPTVLTAIGSGLIYMAGLLGQVAENPRFVEQVTSMVRGSLGTMGGAGHTSMGFSGLAAVIPHLLTCGVAMVPAALAFWVEDETPQPYKPVNGKLAPDDPNATVTQEQKKWVEEYNNAPAIKKPILQKWFREQGFNPDFHNDGTMHLHKHTTAMGMAV